MGALEGQVGKAVAAGGGIATVAEIRARASARQLRRAVADETVVRLRRGVYGLPTLPQPLAVAATLGGSVSHESAALLWEMALVEPPDRLHVTVAGTGTRTPRPDVVLHRTRRLPDVDRDRDGLVTSAARTVLDCASTLPFARALVIADSALRERSVTHDQLLARAAAMAGPGRARRLLVAKHADERAESLFESLLRAVLVERGVTGLEPQVEIRLPTGLRRVDLADRRLRIAIEADSFEHHGSRSALVRDCERHDGLSAVGWMLLRYTWEHVMGRPDWVAATVRSAREARAETRARWASGIV